MEDQTQVLTQAVSVFVLEPAGRRFAARNTSAHGVVAAIPGGMERAVA
jgi:hypothetical protein